MIFLPTVPLLHVLKELMFLLIFCISAGCAFSGSTADGFAGRAYVCSRNPSASGCCWIAPQQGDTETLLVLSVLIPVV